MTWGNRMNNYRRRIQFDNGYAANIICTEHSYGGGEQGLFEIAIMVDGKICYENPLGEGVIGFLDFQQVNETLEKIRLLPKCSKFDPGSAE